MQLYTFPAHNPGIYTGRTGNNTYLLAGAEPTLIDAGVGDPAHIDAIAQALHDAPLARVIVTHAHSDHASGASAIAARWPSARFFKLPWKERDARYAVDWQPLADRQEIAAGDERLVVVHTPGHAPDHICLWHDRTRSVFCGDLAARGTTVVIPGGRGGDVAAYVRSLERVLTLAPAALLPAHGPAIQDDEIERLLRQYIHHRGYRERQVADALAASPATVEDLVALIYPGIHAELAQAARYSVIAHLQKLQEEGHAAENPAGLWTLVTAPG